MKTQNRTGRPAKPIGQKKIYRVNVKMDTKEFYTLKAKSQEAGLLVSECIRQSVFRSVIRQRFTPEFRGLVRQLCGMANNLNQVAHKANAQGYESVSQENLCLSGQIRRMVNHIRYDG